MAGQQCERPADGGVQHGTAFRCGRAGPDRGAVRSGPAFCTNHSLGGARAYAHDVARNALGDKQKNPPTPLPPAAGQPPPGTHTPRPQNRGRKYRHNERPKGTIDQMGGMVRCMDGRRLTYEQLIAQGPHYRQRHEIPV